MHVQWLKRLPRPRPAGGFMALLLTLPALWPLLPAGFFLSDDGRFHVYRIAALADAWSHGVLYPRLFPEFGFGYGQAVVNFYAPLSYVPAALLATLGVNPATAAELTIALGFVLASLAMYGFVRSLWGPAGGVLAAVAYTYFPYHLADAYVRGALPEHFAFIFLPLILWATTAAFRPKDEPAGALRLWGALAWAGLIFTHNLTALLMAPAWVGYVLLLAGWTRRPRRMIAAAAALGLAAGLSAPLWLPFLAENRWVGIALGPSDGYQRHLAPLDLLIQWRPLYHYRVQHGGAADHPLSWLIGVMLAFVAGLFLWRLARRTRIHDRAILAFALTLTLLAIFMMTAASLPVWMPLAPLLANLQYPWRFLTLAAAGFAISLGALPALVSPAQGFPRAIAGSHRRRRDAVPAVVLLALLLQPLPTVPAQPLPFPAADARTPDRMWREDAQAGQVGATWTGEFLPLTVQEQRWALGRPREGATDGPAPTPRPDVRLSLVGYDRIELVGTVAPLQLRLHQFYLPAWRAAWNGVAAATYPTGELGLVTADFPAGAGRASFQFGPTAAWLSAGALAALAALIWAALAWRSGRADRRLRLSAVILLLCVAALSLNRLGVGLRLWTPQPVNAAVGDVALLLGFDSAKARGADALDVTLYWLALRDVGANYKAFVHLLGPDGAVIAQHDGDPVGGFTPTSRWRGGELIADRHRVPLPPDLSPGEYELRAGMYQPAPLRNLPVDPPTGDGRADLGTVRLAGRP